jgi:hypothetical protein
MSGLGQAALQRFAECRVIFDYQQMHCAGDPCRNRFVTEIRFTHCIYVRAQYGAWARPGLNRQNDRPL